MFADREGSFEATVAGAPDLDLPFPTARDEVLTISTQVELEDRSRVPVTGRFPGFGLAIADDQLSFLGSNDDFLIIEKTERPRPTEFGFPCRPAFAAIFGSNPDLSGIVAHHRFVTMYRHTPQRCGELANRRRSFTTPSRLP